MSQHAEAAGAEPAGADGRAAGGGVPCRTGSLWTARQRRGHSIHEISYRACFKPQLPEHFISRLTRPGDVVMDPFMGRGTTVVQAALMGRTGYGSDANPLSEMLTRPRLRVPGLDEVERRLRSIPLGAEPRPEDKPLLAFYHPGTLADIVALKGWLAGRERSGKLDRVDDWIRMVALSRLTGHSPGFFSVRTMPPNQAVRVENQLRLNRRHGLAPPRRDIAALILRKSRSLLRSGTPADGDGHRLACAPADRLGHVPDGSVDLVVTSPPFLDLVDYGRDNWLRCWFAGIDLDQVRIDTHRSLEAWTGFVGACLRELGRTVRPGGHVAFEVGEARKGTVLLETEVLKAARGAPFTPVEVLVNRQRFTKTSNCWGVPNNSAGTNTNRIVLLRRVPSRRRGSAGPGGVPKPL